MTTPSIDDQIEAKWAEVRAYRGRDSYGPSDIDALTQIVLEVQELNAVRAIMELAALPPNSANISAYKPLPRR